MSVFVFRATYYIWSETEKQAIEFLKTLSTTDADDLTIEEVPYTDERDHVKKNADLRHDKTQSEER